MKILHWLRGSTLILLLMPGLIYADDRAVIQKLKNLDVQALLEVEVNLDDAFDIFAALLKRQPVKVATGTLQSAARAPAVTSVITAQDIEAMGARDLDAVLESLPGLHVNRNYIGHNPQYTLRGTPSDVQILMLVNGISIDTLYTGGRNYVWGGMPVSQIARIEVIRGPGSAVYGADAFVGVINIITKNRDDIDGTEVGARYGSNHTYDAWMLHGTRWGAIDVAAMLEYQSTDGDNPWIASDGQTAIDRQLAIFGAPAVSYAPDQLNKARKGIDARLDLSQGLWRLRMGYQARRDVGLGFTVNQVLDPTASQDDDRFSADLSYHNPLLAQNWDVRAQLSYQDMRSTSRDDQRVLPPGATTRVDCSAPQQAQDPRCQALPPYCNPMVDFSFSCLIFNHYPDGLIFNGAFKERQTRFSASALYFGLPNHVLRIGAGYYYGDLYGIEHYVNTDPLTGNALPGGQFTDFSDTPYSFLPEETRSNWHVFAQDSWRFKPDWELTAGLRYDSYSDFGATFNPRLALVWQTSPSLSTKLLYGRAFRAPSFVELYTRNNIAAQGNPDLDAETIDTAELAFDYFINERWHAALNLFTYTWRDAILFVPNASGALTAQNAGQQDSWGVEFEFRGKLTPRLSVLGNYAYQNSRDQQHNQVARVPQHSAYLRSDWLIQPNWYLNTQLTWVGKRQRSVMDSRPTLDGYTTLDLSLRYKNVRQGRWNLALGVRNLLDTEVLQPSIAAGNLQGVTAIPGDIPDAGRRWFVEARYRF
jgi:iron complex outermembrane receptor protein